MRTVDIDKKFGTPPDTLEGWLTSCMRDTGASRHWSLNPLERVWFRGRVSGLETAMTLIGHLRAQSEPRKA